MEKIILDAPSLKSTITCGKNSFEEFARRLCGGKYFVITDSKVYSLYGELIKGAFVGAPIHIIPAGEKSKNYSCLLGILKHMLHAGVTRSYTTVAFGGGVVGDVAGLAASLYMRGIKLVQVPTTLLSQVDSSVGGKTAVDMCGVKNLIGSFYQPSEVVADPVFFHTLPKRELRCGLGEIVKYGALNGDIYDSLCENRARLFDFDFLESIVAPCIRHKSKVVCEDERDVSGVRKTLNLGHTTGHAFELYYKRKSHGEFVLIGMYYELYIAQKSGVCGEAYANSLRDLIKSVVSAVPAYENAGEAAAYAKYDKKNQDQKVISLVIPVKRGECTEWKAPVSDYVKLIEECAAELKELKC